MAWYGWGSPVGLGIALVGVGIAAVLIRFAVFGFESYADSRVRSR